MRPRTCESGAWQRKDLVILFDIVESSELVADLVCELHEGTSVALPGDYSAAQLVLLGVTHPH